MNRKLYCSCDSNFNQFYQRQAGSGFADIEVFRGFPYQRGYGFGSLVKRFGVPILKILGKHALKAGINVGQDILDKKNIRESVKMHAKTGMQDVVHDTLNKANSLINQKGKGIKRKRLYKNSRNRKKKKDIFD